MEQPPVRLYVAGIVAVSLVIFMGTFSYGLADRSRRAEAGAAQVGKSLGTAGRMSVAPAPLAVPESTANRQAIPVASRPAPAGQQAQQKATHTVQPGETLSQIARLYGVAVPIIRSANSLKSDQIKPGQSLTIPGASPLRHHIVEQGDTLWELAVRYGVDIEAILAANQELDPGLLQVGQDLAIPPQTGPAPAAVTGARGLDDVALAGVFSWPVFAPISSPFGPRWGKVHSGVDLAANMGDPIKAARDGEVLVAGTVTGYGYTVILQHLDGTRTLYAHASKLLVRSGQKVHQGDLIALVGSTGHSTGPHLHFEIIVNNRPRDPLLYLPKLLKR